MSECTCTEARAMGADLDLGCPVHDEAAIENARRAAGHHRVCGDVDAGSMLVICECGSLRQHDRPHAYVDTFHAY